jgi:hypothetical protein
MNRIILSAAILFLVLAAPCAAQDPTAVWNGLGHPAGDPAHTASVQHLVLERDRIKITFTDGQIEFVQPLEGKVYGAAFHGHGRVEVAPPNRMETQQLAFLGGQPRLDLEFSEGALYFSDQTFDEVAKQVQWSQGAAGPGELLKARMDEQESNGTSLKPRVFESLLSAEPAQDALFFADLKTRDKGWVEFKYDAREIEEVSVGRWRDWGGGRGFDTWMSFPAAGRSPLEVDLDPGAKAGFLTPGYVIDIRVTSGAELNATTRASIEERRDGERVMLFDFDSNLRVDSVKEEKGTSLAFFQARERKDRLSSTGDYLAVVLPEAGKAGRKFTLEFHYGGKRVVTKVGGGNYFCQSFGWYPAHGEAWYERHNFEITFHTPKKYTLVATGVKTSEDAQGDSTISVWKSETPLAVAGFAFGDFKVLKEKADNIEIEVYANRNPSDAFASLGSLGALPMGANTVELPASLETMNPSAIAKSMAVELANTVRLFQSYFGPFPYKRLAITDIPYSYGQGWPALIYLSAISFLDTTQRNALGIKDQVWVSDFWRAHESSHQWWGHKVSWKTYHDQWLSEGFAEFSGLLYVQFRRNFDEYLNQIKLDRQQLLSSDRQGHRYESLGPVWMGDRVSSSESPGGYRVVIYEKGGLVLNTLRWMLRDQTAQNPDARFMAMMQDFTRTYDNKAASTEDFKAVVEKYMTSAMDVEGNHKLDWFFRQYVYGTGIPQYKLKYDLASGDPGKTRVSLSITRLNDLGPDWVDVVPLYGQVDKKMVRMGWITVRGKEATAEFQAPMRLSALALNVNLDCLIETK